MNHFSQVSHGQVMSVVSNDWVAERLYETDAISLLRNIKKTEASQKGINGALNDPARTLESLPDGLSNLLQDSGAAISSAAEAQGTGPRTAGK